MKTISAAYLKDASVLESSTTSGMIQRFVYESVQTGLTKDLVNHSENVRHGYSSIVTKLRQASIESSENMYGFLSQFQMLRTVEDFFETESEEGLPGIAQTFVSKWRTHDKINQADFKFQEPILSLRGVLLHSYAERLVDAFIQVLSLCENNVINFVASAFSLQKPKVVVGASLRRNAVGYSGESKRLWAT